VRVDEVPVTSSPLIDGRIMRPGTRGLRLIPGRAGVWRVGAERIARVGFWFVAARREAMRERDATDGGAGGMQGLMGRMGLMDGWLPRGGTRDEVLRGEFTRISVNRDW